MNVSIKIFASRIVLPLIFSTFAFAQDKGSDDIMRLFGNYAINENDVAITTAANGTRYLFQVGDVVDNTKSRVLAYSETVRLNKAEPVSFIEKNVRVDILPVTSASATTWIFHRTTDMRSMGGALVSDFTGFLATGSRIERLSPDVARSIFVNKTIPTSPQMIPPSKPAPVVQPPQPKAATSQTPPAVLPLPWKLVAVVVAIVATGAAAHKLRR